MRKLAFMMALLVALCISAAAEESSGKFMFSIQQGGTYVLSYYIEGTVKDVIIPEKHKERKVTTIGTNAFGGCSTLTSITIPDSVTTINGDAFSGCSSLTSITIPDGVTFVDNKTFSGCTALMTVNLPNNLTAIGKSAFRDCTSLISITIPNGVTSIAEYAFKNCSSLKSINIPNGVTSIESHAFEGCSVLTSISIPGGVTSIGSFAFSHCSSLTAVKLPDSLTSIGKYAFRAHHADLTFYVGCGSYAEQYAIDNGIHYVCGCNGSSDTPAFPGDANDDNTVDTSDAIDILQNNADGQEVNTNNADVDADGDVDIHDVLLILQYVAGWANVVLK